MKHSQFKKGIIYATVGSLWWGILGTLFFKYISSLGALEVTIHRVIWTSVILFFTSFIFKKFDEFKKIFKQKNKLIVLFFTSILIFLNWGTWIYAISVNKIIDASYGYFIFPIFNVFLGYIFLKEKINFKRILSIFAVLISSLYLLFNLESFPWVGFLVVFFWGTYNLLRKKIRELYDVGVKEGTIVRRDDGRLPQYNPKDYRADFDGKDAQTIDAELNNATSVQAEYYKDDPDGPDYTQWHIPRYTLATWTQGMATSKYMIQCATAPTFVATCASMSAFTSSLPTASHAFATMISIGGLYIPGGDSVFALVVLAVYGLGGIFIPLLTIRWMGYNPDSTHSIAMMIAAFVGVIGWLMLGFGGADGIFPSVPGMGAAFATHFIVNAIRTPDVSSLGRFELPDQKKLQK